MKLFIIIDNGVLENFRKTGFEVQIFQNDTTIVSA